MRRRQLEPSQSFTAGMPAKLNSGQLRRHAGGKDWDGQYCRRLLVSYRNSIPGSAGGNIAGASAAYENQALVLNGATGTIFQVIVVMRKPPTKGFLGLRYTLLPYKHVGQKPLRARKGFKVLLHCEIFRATFLAGMAQWWEHSASCLCTERFFSGYSGFPLSSKSQDLPWFPLIVNFSWQCPQLELQGKND